MPQLPPPLIAPGMSIAINLYASRCAAVGRDYLLTLNSAKREKPSYDAESSVSTTFQQGRTDCWVR